MRKRGPRLTTLQAIQEIRAKLKTTPIGTVDEWWRTRVRALLDEENEPDPPVVDDTLMDESIGKQTRAPQETEELGETLLHGSAHYDAAQFDAQCRRIALGDPRPPPVHGGYPDSEPASRAVTMAERFKTPGGRRDLTRMIAMADRQASHERRTVTVGGPFWGKRDRRHRDGDRRAPDHERRGFGPRRRKTGLPVDRYGVNPSGPVRYHKDRRKAQNSNQARRQGPRDRRDLDELCRECGEPDCFCPNPFGPGGIPR